MLSIASRKVSLQLYNTFALLCLQNFLPTLIFTFFFEMTSDNHTKYIIVTGGVISGIGKGVIASSTGLVLKSLGYKVTSIKIDPYLNIDAGTMTPLDHGEVFVLDDGGEVDLDLGNYERFLDIRLTRDNNITTGKIYDSVIKKEVSFFLILEKG